MIQLKETKEILSTKIWCINPAFAKGVHSLILSYLSRKESSKQSIINNDDKEESLAEKYSQMLPGLRCEGKQVLLLNNPERFFRHKDKDENSDSDDVFIDIIDMCAPITRYGGWCSSGSIDHRNQMIFSSKQSNCIGHVMIVDTPGGSAYAMNDYQVGVKAAKEANQPVLAFIDGGCYSAGVAAVCQADEVYALHPNCEIGCIGVMGSFVTMADGTEQDGYVYHELYDPESFDKNKSYRDVANDNDTKLFLKELAETGAEFRNLVRSQCPNVKEDMLHGKVYKAENVQGVLVDGIASFEDVVGRVIAIYQGAPLIDKTVSTADDAVSDDNDEEVVDDNEEEDDDEIPPTIVPEGTAFIKLKIKPSIIEKHGKVQEH